MLLVLTVLKPLQLWIMFVWSPKKLLSKIWIFDQKGVDLILFIFCITLGIQKKLSPKMSDLSTFIPAVRVYLRGRVGVNMNPRWFPSISGESAIKKPNAFTSFRTDHVQLIQIKIVLIACHAKTFSEKLYSVRNWRFSDNNTMNRLFSMDVLTVTISV